jgi:sigma-B regulation protein RsbU (phosphoserine phosphatase)
MTQIDRVLSGERGAWQKRLASVVEMSRSMSAQTDPQAMVQDYSRRMRNMYKVDGFVSLSRRDLNHPDVRVTRASIWGTDVNPWKQTRDLTIHHGGLFSELIYLDEPSIIDDLQLADGDPAAPFVAGMRSLLATPLFDKGTALNMIISMRKEPNSFDRADLPERVWMSNLFGRATHNLVLSEQVKHAYEQVDRELKVVGDIQRSLLPAELPEIPGMDLAVHYQTSKRSGGDYYDFFPLPGTHGEPAGSPRGRWGIFIGDVSGHGTPAAVLMAVTHSIAHTHNGPPAPPSSLMSFVNGHLAARYTGGQGKFVTALYGIYDPVSREMTYACAGHCPPRVRRANGQIESSFTEAALPLGIDGDEEYPDGVVRFAPGDLLVLYTDGITEARSADGEMFDVSRLDAAIEQCPHRAGDALGCILDELGSFTGLHPPQDDQTLLLAAFR